MTDPRPRRLESADDLAQLSRAAWRRHPARAFFWFRLMMWVLALVTGLVVGQIGGLLVVWIR